MTQSPHPDRRADVDPAQAATMVERGEATLLDVREAREWTAGHAPEARHMPLADLRADDVPSDIPIIAVCRSGNRSGKAADLLAASGVPVHNLAGGMKAWAAAGRPIITDAGSAGTVA